MLPKHVRYQTALHPVSFKPIQATKDILHKPSSIVKGFHGNFAQYFLYSITKLVRAGCPSRKVLLPNECGRHGMGCAGGQRGGHAPVAKLAAPLRVATGMHREARRSYDFKPVILLYATRLANVRQPHERKKFVTDLGMARAICAFASHAHASYTCASRTFAIRAHESYTTVKSL